MYYVILQKFKNLCPGELKLVFFLNLNKYFSSKLFYMYKCRKLDPNCVEGTLTTGNRFPKRTRQSCPNYRFPQSETSKPLQHFSSLPSWPTYSVKASWIPHLSVFRCNPQRIMLFRTLFFVGMFTSVSPQFSTHVTIQNQIVKVHFHFLFTYSSFSMHQLWVLSGDNIIALILRNDRLHSKYSAMFKHTLFDVVSSLKNSLKKGFVKICQPLVFNFNHSQIAGSHFPRNTWDH